MTVITFNKGDRVEFTRSHDPGHKLCGTVQQVKDNDEVLVKTEPDGVLVWTDTKHVTDYKPGKPVAASASGAATASGAADPKK